MWAKVRRQVAGRRPQSCMDGISADTLNARHDRISTDVIYRTPQYKQTAATRDDHLVAE